MDSVSAAFASHAPALLLLAGLLVAWAGVQHAFRRRVPHPEGDPDALAGRTSCGGPACAGGACDTGEPCPRRRPPPAGPEEET